MKKSHQKITATGVLFIAMLILVVASPADAYTVQIVNTNGTPQAETSIYDVTTDEVIGYSDADGMINFDIGAASLFVDTRIGDILSATRTVYADDRPCQIAPEGWPGVVGWALPLIGASKIVVPTVPGTALNPDISDKEAQLVWMINQQRSLMNMPQLRISTVLSTSADKYLSVLANFQTLNFSDPNTSCLSSGPGIRAVDAGFPTLQNILESVIQGSDANSALSALEDDYSADGSLSDSKATLIGVAEENGRWVIDTSEIGSSAPGYEHTGDTGSLGSPPPPVPTAAPVPVSAPASSPVIKPKTAKLRIKRIHTSKSLVSVAVRLKRKARGKITVTAIRLHNRHDRVRFDIRRHRQHLDRVTAEHHLRPGLWIIKVKFIAKDQHWKTSVIHRRCRVVR